MVIVSNLTRLFY